MSKSKSSRKAQRRQDVKQQKRKRNLILGGAVAVAIISAIALIAYSTIGSGVEGEFSFGTQNRGHDEGVVIDAGALPPVGGIHSPRWQSCGIYDQPIELKNAVHSMEHGAVWITYRPALPVEDVERLRDEVRGQSYLLLSPYPGLESEIVLTAWGVQLAVDSVTDERIAQFVEQYRLGPQTPEFGATCDDGVGRPIG
jgi:hypothetical protein